MRQRRIRRSRPRTGRRNSQRAQQRRAQHRATKAQRAAMARRRLWNSRPGETRIIMSAGARQNYRRQGWNIYSVQAKCWAIDPDYEFDDGSNQGLRFHEVEFAYRGGHRPTQWSHNEWHDFVVNYFAYYDTYHTARDQQYHAHTAFVVRNGQGQVNLWHNENVLGANGLYGQGATYKLDALRDEVSDYTPETGINCLVQVIWNEIIRSSKTRSLPIFEHLQQIKDLQQEFEKVLKRKIDKGITFHDVRLWWESNKDYRNGITFRGLMADNKLAYKLTAKKRRLLFVAFQLKNRHYHVIEDPNLRQSLSHLELGETSKLIVERFRQQQRSEPINSENHIYVNKEELKIVKEEILKGEYRTDKEYVILESVIDREEAFCYGKRSHMYTVAAQVADATGIIPDHLFPTAMSFIHPVSRQHVIITEDYEIRKQMLEEMQREYTKIHEYPNANFEWRNQSESGLINSVLVESGDVPRSVYGPTVARTFNKAFPRSLWQQHVDWATYDIYKEHQYLLTVDINKAFSVACMDMDHDEIPIYSVMDSIEDVPDILEVGFYYLKKTEIKNSNGVLLYHLPEMWASLQFTSFLLTTGSIKRSDIVAFIGCRKTVSGRVASYLVGKIATYLPSQHLNKRLMNKLTGCIGIHQQKKIIAVLDNDRAMADYLAYNKAYDYKQVYCRPANDNLYVAEYREVKEKTTNHLTIYASIICRANMQVHKMMTQFSSSPYVKLLYVKVDEIGVGSSHPIKYCSVECSKPPKDISSSAMLKMLRKHKYSIKENNCLQKWQQYDPEKRRSNVWLVQAFKAKLPYIENPTNKDFRTRNSIIEGPPGCGKSFKIKTRVKQARKKKKRVLILSPMHSVVNQHADRIKCDGVVFSTCHAACGLSFDGSTKSRAVNLADFDLCIVDEFGCLDGGTLLALHRLFQTNKKCVIMLFGDSQQLEPVSMAVAYDFVKTRIALDLLGPNGFYTKMVFHEAGRYSMDHHAATQTISTTGKLEKSYWRQFAEINTPETFRDLVQRYPKHLAFTNKMRARINKIKHEQFLLDNNLPEDTIVAVTEPIRIIDGYKGSGFTLGRGFVLPVSEVNSETGEVTVVYKDNSIVLKKNKYELGYSETWHSAQGKSITVPHCVWGIGCRYVSRQGLFSVLTRVNPPKDVHESELLKIAVRPDHNWSKIYDDKLRTVIQLRPADLIAKQQKEYIYVLPEANYVGRTNNPRRRGLEHARLKHVEESPQVLFEFVSNGNERELNRIEQLVMAEYASKNGVELTNIIQPPKKAEETKKAKKKRNNHAEQNISKQDIVGAIKIAYSNGYMKIAKRVRVSRTKHLNVIVIRIRCADEQNKALVAKAKKKFVDQLVVELSKLRPDLQWSSVDFDI